MILKHKKVLWCVCISCMLLGLLIWHSRYALNFFTPEDQLKKASSLIHSTTKRQVRIESLLFLISYDSMGQDRLHMTVVLETGTVQQAEQIEKSKPKIIDAYVLAMHDHTVANRVQTISHSTISFLRKTLKTATQSVIGSQIPVEIFFEKLEKRNTNESTRITEHHGPVTMFNAKLDESKYDGEYVKRRRRYGR